jgi:hypothetical protein
MLLGFAREGNLLAHDRDADFALLRADLPKLLRTVPALRRAGFKPLQQFRNNRGELTELTFRRHSAKFEFFIFDSDDGKLRYSVFGYPPNHLVEIDAEISDQELVPFEFVRRTWLKHSDHESELEAMYGDWRTPHKDWDYLNDDLAVVAKRPWTNTQTTWLDLEL